MSISITPEGMVVFKLPRKGELIAVTQRGSSFCVTGLNSDRGFAWAVGKFTDYASAIEVARMHYHDELKIAGCI